MKLTNAFAGVCCGILFVAACNKSKNETDNKSAIRQMLENGKWQQSAYTGTVNYMGVDSTADLYSQRKECDKDDFIFFYDDGKATIDEGANKCPDDAQIETAHWTLLDNDSKLAIVDDNPDTMNLEITNTQMKLMIVKLNSSGLPVTYVGTYKNIK
jgi:hypothetical protein